MLKSKGRFAPARRRAVGGGAALACLAIALAPVAAATQSPKKAALTPLQEGMKYYAGKTVTFVAADSPGGGFDQYARDYAPYLGQYLHANFTVENIPAGNTIAGQDAVANSQPNGLTVGWLNAGPDIEDTVLHLPGLNFNPIREAWLGNTAPANDAIAALTSATCRQWASWKDVVADSSASNPVSEPIQTTGSTTFLLVLANGVFGVHAKTIPGYGSSAALLQGWERGDGCVAIDPTATIGPLVKGGIAKPLLLNTTLQPANAYAQTFAGTPTFTQAEKSLSKYIKTKLQKIGVVALAQAGTTPRGFFVPGSTPGAEVAALRAAFKWASLNPSLQATLTAQGNPTGYQSGPAGKANYETFLAAAERVKSYLAPIQ